MHKAGCGRAVVLKAGPRVTLHSRFVTTLASVAVVTAAVSACTTTTAGHGSARSKGTDLVTSISPRPPSSADIPASELPDPCTLLRPDEAKALAGTAVRAPVRAPIPGPTLCQYNGLASATSVLIQVRVGRVAKETFYIDRNAHPDEFRALPAVGDEAWEYGAAGVIWVRRGRLWARIGTILADEAFASLRPRLERAAAIMASRM